MTAKFLNNAVKQAWQTIFSSLDSRHHPHRKLLLFTIIALVAITAVVYTMIKRVNQNLDELPHLESTWLRSKRAAATFHESNNNANKIATEKFLTGESTSLLGDRIPSRAANGNLILQFSERSGEQVISWLRRSREEAGLILITLEMSISSRNTYSGHIEVSDSVAH